MSEERPRIILEKSSTVRRRYQRSDKRFKFTAQQLKRIEREEQLEKRAKDIREKEKRRIANKKKKLEQETKAREEARRQGLPDPNAPKIPSSQPLLSKFLGFASRPPTEEPTNKEELTNKEEPTNKEPTSEDESATSPRPAASPVSARDDQVMGDDSVGGDTEAESDAFDDLDEELEQEMSALEETAILAETEPDLFDDDLDEELEQEISALEETALLPESKSNHNDTSRASENTSKESLDTGDDDDEFSDCSAFYDDDILKEVEAATTTQTIEPAVNTQTSQCGPLASRRTPNVINRTFLQPPNNDLKSNSGPLPSLNSSFRDETADYLEEMFSHGCGDSFGELLELGTKPR